MSRRLTQEEFVTRGKKVHEGKYSYEKACYVKGTQKVVITCPIHGDFEQTPENHLQGHGCPSCYRDKQRSAQMMTTKEFIERSRAVHGDKYDYSESRFIGALSPITIICPLHGPFVQQASSHYNHGSGCSQCARLKHCITQEEFIERAQMIHGNKYDYSKTIFSGVKNPIVIICKEHGEFTQNAGSHLEGHGCIKCAVEIIKEKEKDTLEDFIAKATAVHGNRYDYSAANYVNSITPIVIRCEIHGEFLQKPDTHLHASCGCPKCAEIQKIETMIKNGTIGRSRPEKELHKLLIQHFGSDDVQHQYKEERYPFACDFYIKSLDLFIELNAHWTHGGHWFDENDEDDRKQLAFLREKSASSYQKVIYTWAVRDPLKRKTAEDNNLNYLVFWDNDLADAKAWLEAQ